MSGLKRQRHRERGDLLCALRGERIFGQRLNTEDTENTESTEKTPIVKGDWAYLTLAYLLDWP
jgi:hypothetical protein